VGRRATSLLLAVIASTSAAAIAVSRLVVDSAPRPAVGMRTSELPPPSFVAREASVSTRRDERASGLVFHHRLLRLEAVTRTGPMSMIPAGSALVYAGGPELEDRVQAVLDGRVPVERGLEATFAVGRLVPAEIVRIGPDGRVASIESTRVAFVSITLP
jgi:hypothetical protein